ncbi:YqgE/AlgH family protein [Nisaea nitritireducens]|uniref:YqgE/AlgH family protein n=1 Tax=Nisaea nitritireducens TaxID=568392 RepID=UPI001866D25F|nr:YqgE/AlgH family protein [Nisaea nitritireducens]
MTSTVAEETQEGYLTGQLLVAMPAMRDPRFARSVIYICVHNAEGAIGLVVNRLVGSIEFSDLIEQLDMQFGETDLVANPPVHFGGPVDTERGFVLHSADYQSEETLDIDKEFGLTATIDIVRTIASGSGPKDHLLALGYAGWGPGQLDSEIQENAWLNVDADNALVFDTDLDSKWDRALAKLGVDSALLSTEAGRA